MYKYDVFNEVNKKMSGYAIISTWNQLDEFYKEIPQPKTLK